MATLNINGIDTPVRFSMRAIALYFEQKGKSLADLAGLSFLEVQDVYWIAVCEGCRKAKVDNPFASDIDFFDALDDDKTAMEALSLAMSESFGGGDEKNEPTPAK